MKSEDKTVLEELGVAFCASLSDDIRHKRADAGLVKTAHHLVEQGEESVPETLRRDLCCLCSSQVCALESKFRIILLFYHGIPT